MVVHYRPGTDPRARLYEFVSDNLKYARGSKVEALHNAGEEIDRQEFAEMMPEDWFWTLGYLSGKALRDHREGDVRTVLLVIDLRRGFTDRLDSCEVEKVDVPLCFYPGWSGAEVVERLEGGYLTMLPP